MKQRSLFNKPKSSPPEPVQKQDVVEGQILIDKNSIFYASYIEKSKLTSSDDIEMFENIQRHRLRILIMSAMYYDRDMSLVPDFEYDRYGHELVKLQKERPDIADMVVFAKEFADYDASTGFDLPIRHPWVIAKTDEIIEMKRRTNYG